MGVKIKNKQVIVSTDFDFNYNKLTNLSDPVDPGDAVNLSYLGDNYVSEVTSSTTDQLTVANGTSTPALSIVTGAVANTGTALATGDQIYDFVIGLGYQSTASLYSYTGITSNQDIGSLNSGNTLGMVYITNNGTASASVNLGTTSTGNEITPHKTIDVASGETISVTVNMRLSATLDTTMYINSSSWTNLDLDLEWADITYQSSSGSGGGGTGTVTEVSSNTTNQLTVSNATTTPNITVVTGAVTNGGTPLATGDQIYDFVIGLGYGVGTVTSVGGTGTINGLTLTGTVTTTGNLTLGGTLAINNADWSGTDLSVENGGTGLSTVGTDYILTGNGTSALTAESKLTFDGSKLTIDGELQVNVMSTGTTNDAVYYDVTTSGFTYGSGGGSGSGGFLGTATKDTSEPSNLSNNQWVAPSPTTGGTYEYTFDNFLNQSSNGITVNLAEEDVYLRYNDSGSYWVKESFNKPLASGKTWVGDSNDAAKEIEVIEEWDTSSGVTDIGQKYDQDVQTLMKVSAVKTAYIQNFSFTQDIDLTTVGNTTLISSMSGKKLLVKTVKLIILNSMTPTDSMTVNVGTNSSSYNNVVNGLTIDDVLVDEYYELTLVKVPSGSDGTIVSISSTPLIFKVSSKSTSTPLNGHILLEGFIY